MTRLRVASIAVLLAAGFLFLVGVLVSGSATASLLDGSIETPTPTAVPMADGTSDELDVLADADPLAATFPRERALAMDPSATSMSSGGGGGGGGAASRARRSFDSPEGGSDEVAEPSTLLLLGAGLLGVGLRRLAG